MYNTNGSVRSRVSLNVWYKGGTHMRYAVAVDITAITYPLLPEVQRYCALNAACDQSMQ